jgi:hypothetical protein
VLDLWHPDIEWTNLLGERYEGKLNCVRYADDVVNTSQSYTLTYGEPIDLGGDHVLARHEAEMRGANSGAEGRVTVFTLFTVRHGLIVGMAEYLDRDDALKAAGLEE